MKNLGNSWTEVINSLKVGNILKVTVTKHRHFGFFVDVPDTKHEGLVEIMHIKDEIGVSPTEFPAIGSEIEAIVLGFREHNHQIVLSIKPSDFAKAN